MIHTFELKLGNILPDKYYPIFGEITLHDSKTMRPLFVGKCEIPKYNYNNNYILITEYSNPNKLDDGKKMITIKASDIPLALQYQIKAEVNNYEGFNRLLITGLCKPEASLTFTLGDPVIFKVIPIIGYGGDNTKLCNLDIWKM